MLLLSFLSQLNENYIYIKKKGGGGKWDEKIFPTFEVFTFLVLVWILTVYHHCDIV